ncbi:hypothetical protein [Cellulomonas pakistanensis]|nr:hypothetical protein [Cellulomonas pakistanensis]
MLDDGPRLETVGGSPRPVYWGVVVVCGLLGAGLAVVGLLALTTLRDARGAWGPGAGAGAVAGGLAWLAVTWTFHRSYLHDPRPDPRKVLVERVGDEPAVVVVWRTTFHWQPVFVSAVVLLAAGGWTLGLVRAGHWAWWVPVLVVVPLLLAMPDKVLELARPLRLVLTPRGLGTTALDGDAWLDWDDVRGVAVVQDNQWSVVRVVPVSRPGSWTYRRRRRFVSVPAPDGPCLDVPGPAFPVDHRHVVVAIEHYRRTPAARSELAGEAGRRRVLGEAG